MSAAFIPHFDLTSELLPGVPSEHYNQVRKCMVELLETNTTQGEDTLSPKISKSFANYLWLVYERVSLGKFRELDYNQVQSFSTKNKDLIEYLFVKLFPDESIESVASWIEPSIEMLDCGLHRPSNRYNKHVFH